MSLNLTINPALKMKSDIMFKAFFNRKENEGFLEEFLESILKRKVIIKTIGHDLRLEQLSKDQKFGILDLGVELENGEFINIEIQLRNYKNIEKRTLFYASKKVTEQLDTGDDFRNLKPIIVIAILDYSFIELPEYITETVRVASKHREYEINNDVKYYYIELNKFRKQNPDMSDTLSQWLSFLDMEREDLLEMACKNNKKVKKAFENYNVLTGDAEIKRLAQIRLMSQLEEKSALATARDKGTKEGIKIGIEEGKKQGIEEGKKQGIEEGKKQGIEEGKKQGIEEGKKQGIEEGKKQEKEKIAKELFKQGIEISKISKITGITIGELLKLKNEK